MVWENVFLSGFYDFSGIYTSVVHTRTAASGSPCIALSRETSSVTTHLTVWHHLLNTCPIALKWLSHPLCLLPSHHDLLFLSVKPVPLCVCNCHRTVIYSFNILYCLGSSNSTTDVAKFVMANIWLGDLKLHSEKFFFCEWNLPTNWVEQVDFISNFWSINLSDMNMLVFFVKQPKNTGHGTARYVCRSMSTAERVY